ncbi:MAG: GAF domain-containing protein [Anaerolineae bacterium]
MNERGRRRLDGVRQAWHRLVTVNGSAATHLDAEKVRKAVLLNTLIVGGFGVAVGITVAIAVASRLGYLAFWEQTAGFLFFPFILLAISALAITMAKRGEIDRAAWLYVWVTFVTVVAAAILLDGYRSAGWLLVIWPVVLAGTLLRAWVGLLSAFGAVAIYGAVAAAQAAGVYTPVVTTPAGGFLFFGLFFGWLMIVIAAGLVTYVNGTSLHRALAGLSEASRDLELARRALSEDIAVQSRELRERAGQFRAIAELGQATASVRDVDELMSTAVNLISQRLGFYHAGIFLLDAPREWAVLRAASSEGGRRMLARRHRLRVGEEGIVGYVAEMGISRIALDVDDDTVWVSSPDLPETKSEMALPLISGDQVLGVLDIQTTAVAAFDEDDIDVLQVLADSLATAIANAELLEETRAAMRRLERYQETDAVQAWRRALARRNLRVGYSYVSGETTSSRPDEIDPEGTWKGLVGVTRQTTESGEHTLLAPITVGGRRLGMLSFERSAPWSDEAVQLVEAVLDQLDLALDNARLLEETQRTASQEAARSQIVGRIRALTSTDAILRSAAEQLGKALHVERSRIQLVQFDD